MCVNVPGSVTNTHVRQCGRLNTHLHLIQQLVKVLSQCELGRVGVRAAIDVYVEVIIVAILREDGAAAATEGGLSGSDTQ